MLQVPNNNILYMHMIICNFIQPLDELLRRRSGKGAKTGEPLLICPQLIFVIVFEQVAHALHKY